MLIEFPDQIRISPGFFPGIEAVVRKYFQFMPDKYRDEYRERVQAMLEEKSKGQEITVAAPEAPRHAQIIDLMRREAYQGLSQSMEKGAEGNRTRGKDTA